MEGSMSLEECLNKAIIKERIAEARKRMNDAAPLRMGICCGLCKSWDWQNQTGEEAPCRERGECVPEHMACALFEDDESDRVQDIAKDFEEDLRAWRQARE